MPSTTDIALSILAATASSAANDQPDAAAPAARPPPRLWGGRREPSEGATAPVTRQKASGDWMRVEGGGNKRSVVLPVPGQRKTLLSLGRPEPRKYKRRESSPQQAPVTLVDGAANKAHKQEQGLGGGDGVHGTRGGLPGLKEKRRLDAWRHQERNSRFIGVSWEAGSGGNSKPWSSAVVISGKVYSLGSFRTDEEAAAAYDEHASILGAPISFPEEEEGDGGIEEEEGKEQEEEDGIESLESSATINGKHSRGAPASSSSSSSSTRFASSSSSSSTSTSRHKIPSSALISNKKQRARAKVGFWSFALANELRETNRYGNTAWDLDSTCSSDEETGMLRSWNEYDSAGNRRYDPSHFASVDLDDEEEDPPSYGVRSRGYAPWEGARVKVRFNKKNWYGADVQRVFVNSIRIVYDDGTVETTPFPDKEVVVLEPMPDSTQTRHFQDHTNATDMSSFLSPIPEQTTTTTRGSKNGTYAYMKGKQQSPPKASGKLSPSLSSSSSSSSEVKGVSWEPVSKKWRATLALGGEKNIYLGDFNTEQQACSEYDRNAIQHRMPLNDPEEQPAYGSRFYGVEWDPSSRKFSVRIGKDLGLFESEEKAAVAYDKVAARIGKPLNFYEPIAPKGKRMAKNVAALPSPPPPPLPPPIPSAAVTAAAAAAAAEVEPSEEEGVIRSKRKRTVSAKVAGVYYSPLHPRVSPSLTLPAASLASASSASSSLSPTYPSPLSTATAGGVLDERITAVAANSGAALRMLAGAALAFAVSYSVVDVQQPTEPNGSGERCVEGASVGVGLPSDDKNCSFPCSSSGECDSTSSSLKRLKGGSAEDSSSPNQEAEKEGSSSSSSRNSALKETTAHGLSRPSLSHTGVCWHAPSSTWLSYIQVGGSKSSNSSSSSNGNFNGGGGGGDGRPWLFAPPANGNSGGVALLGTHHGEVDAAANVYTHAARLGAIKLKIGGAEVEDPW